VAIKGPIACNGFGFKEILTERVIAHPITLSAFFPGFHYESRSQVTYAKMDSILAYKVSCVAI